MGWTRRIAHAVPLLTLALAASSMAATAALAGEPPPSTPVTGAPPLLGQTP